MSCIANNQILAIGSGKGRVGAGKMSIKASIYAQGGQARGQQGEDNLVFALHNSSLSSP
jgi:hypothetical protein